MEITKNIGLVFIPLPKVGHLISMVELAKNLILRPCNKDELRNPKCQFKITIFTSPPEERSSEISSYISSVESAADSGTNITFHEIPGLGIRREDLTSFLKSRVKTAITDIHTPIAAVIVDMFLTAMLHVTDELGLPLYVYFSASASFLGLVLYIPYLDHITGVTGCGKERKEDEEHDLSIHLPGFSSVIPYTALPGSLLHREDQLFSMMLSLSLCYRKVKGIIVNSFKDLQPHSIKALEDGRYVPDGSTPPTYPVGPLLSLDSNSNSSSSKDAQGQHECIQWLNGQPSKSVLFLCFGSAGSFSPDQAREISIGLERSGHRFLWVLVLKMVETGTTSGQPLIAPVLHDVLPEGFVERTKGKGLIWLEFAPQADILRHKSVGGFVTHCGWNSTLESLWFGVPMLAWPLYAEQHLNCFDMVKEMEVALGLKVDRMAGNWVEAEELERGVRCLMDEGCCDQSKKVRSNVTEISRKMRTTLTTEGGSSFLSMESLASVLLNYSNNDVEFE